MTDIERIVALERRVRDLEAQVELLLERVGGRAPAPPEQSRYDATVVAELRQGNVINAIKRYREVTGVGLAQAKAACEEIAVELGVRR